MNYKNNTLEYKREEKVKLPDGTDIEVVGGFWKDPITIINGNMIKAEIAFVETAKMMQWAPLRSYNFDSKSELDKEMDSIIEKMKAGKEI